MKKFRQLSEQYREEGRHKLIYPKNKPVVSPRAESDSAKAKLKEAIKDKYDIGEYDQEGDMAKSDLRSILANAKRVHDMLKDDDNLPEWVQSKITKAEDYMSTVANYLEAEMNEAVKMPKQTRAEKEYRKITGKTVDQRLSELDKVQKDLAKQREDYIKQGIIKAESVEELDEALRHEIAGQVARFIGNKIDPVHGDIMHAHGKEAYRQAAYHIRKTVHHVSQAVSDLHDKLHKHLRTGTLTMEEIEELDEGKYSYGAFRLGPGVGRFSSRGRAQHQGLEDPRTGLPLGFSNPPKKDEPKKDEPKKVKEEVELQELSKELLARYKEKAEKSRNKELGYLRQSKEREKILAHANKYRNRRIGLSRVEDRLKKEEVELSEAMSHSELADHHHRLADHYSKVSDRLENQGNSYDADHFGEVTGAHRTAARAHEKAAKTGNPQHSKEAHEESKTANSYDVSESVKHLEEKNVPTSPEKWAQAKAQAKAKFDVYPSAYANGWAAKKYKEMGGGWKSVSEEKEKDDLPFTPDKPKKKSVVVGKKPEGYSVARQLARQAMQRYTKPVKEEKDMSKKAKIVKGVLKKNSDDQFNAEPEISKSIIRNN